MLIESFAYTLFFELGSIISLDMGWVVDGFRSHGQPASPQRVIAANKRNPGAIVATQDNLASAWNVNKGTVSKWVSEWERNGTIPARQQIGRYKTISPS